MLIIPTTIQNIICARARVFAAVLLVFAAVLFVSRWKHANPPSNHSGEA